MGNEWVPALFIAAVAAIIDIRRGIIPNWLTLPGFLGGLAWHLLFAEGRGVLFALTGAVSTLLLFLVPFLRGGVGGGDFKLLAAIGSFLGPWSGLRAAVAAALAGGALAAALLLARARRAGRAGVRRYSLSGERGRDWGTLPYGPAIAMGTALCVIAS